MAASLLHRSGNSRKIMPGDSDTVHKITPVQIGFHEGIISSFPGFVNAAGFTGPAGQPEKAE